MAHVIYSKKTWKIYTHPSGQIASYPKESVALGQFTKLKNRGVLTDADFTVEEQRAYEKKIPLVKTHNMLNPKAGEFDIRADLKGTCCDPATERYHSM